MPSACSPSRSVVSITSMRRGFRVIWRRFFNCRGWLLWKA